MNTKDQTLPNQKQTIRYKIIEVHASIINAFNGPSYLIQAILEVFIYLQILKYPIDYLSIQWFSSHISIISYLDLSYPFRSIVPNLYMPLYYIFISIIGIYLILFFSLFHPFSQASSKLIASILKILFIFFSTIGFIPLVSLLINSLSCQYQNQIWKCYDTAAITSAGKIIGFAIGGLFIVLLIIQSFLKFDFLFIQGQSKLLRDSTYQSTALLLYIIINQTMSLFTSKTSFVIINIIMILLMIILFLFKDQNQISQYQKIQFSLLLVNFAFGICTLTNLFISTSFQFSFCPIISFIILIIGLQYQHFSINFEIENINKWNSPDLMMKYSKSLSRLAKRANKNNFQFIIQTHGYIDQHQRKCQMQECPIKISQQVIKSHKLGKFYENSSIQIKRICALIKKIYMQGEKVSPQSQQLQLQYAIFLYQTGQRDLSLKTLLLLQYQQLSIQKYYKYYILKTKIYSQIRQQSQKQFLDLLSELQVKRISQQLLDKFEDIALTNLQFWSVLNEDHPDFQKLNDVGIKLIKLENQIRKDYAQISKYAYNQRITNLYTQYLISIQNDEGLFNQISQRVKKRYDLINKIVLQDWDNSTLAIILISAQQSNYGHINDLNSTFASMIGYEKYQLMNRHCKVLFSQRTIGQLKRFLTVDQDQKNDQFYLHHKNGYLIKVNRIIQNFNSMQTGFTFIITADYKMPPATAFFIIEANTCKILGSSSTSISMLNFQQKNVEAYVSIDDVFNITRQQLLNTQQKGPIIISGYKLFSKGFMDKKSIKDTYNDDSCEFSMSYTNLDGQIGSVKIYLSRYSTRFNEKRDEVVNFKFQIQASLSDFKYFSVSQGENSYLRGFSMLSYHSDMNRSQTARNYQQNIKTYRLLNNVIMHIEEDQQQNQQLQRRLQNNSQNMIIDKMQRKNEEAIFLNKDTYNDFIRSRQIKTFLSYVLLAGIIISVILYLVFFFIFITQNQTIDQYFAQLTNQNLLIGTIAKTQSYMQNYVQHNQSKSLRNLEYIPDKFYTVIQRMQQIRLNGSVPYPMPIFLNNMEIIYVESDQFVLSYANYGLEFLPKIQVAKTSTQVQTIFQAIDNFTIFNLIINGKQAREYMIQQKNYRKKQITDALTLLFNIQILLFVCGTTFQLIFVFFICLFIYKLRQHKISLLRAFLEITQLQIIKFTNKTESFISILHMEENSGESDQNEQQNQIKKVQSMFAKKKSFKIIKLSKSIYFKLILLAIISEVYFIQTFLIGSQNTTIMKKSLQYSDIVSSADYFLYQRLVNYQQQFLGGTNQKNGTAQIMKFYSNLLQQHYQTFANYESYQRVFMDIFLQNVCNGSVQLKFACIQSLYPVTSKGIMVLVSDLIMKIQQRFKNYDFQKQFYVQYQVLSEAHENLTKNLVIQQKMIINETKNQLIHILLIWTFCLAGIGLLYVMPILKRFLNQMSYNKDMLTLLPISIAKQSLQANIQINKFLKQQSLENGKILKSKA